MRSVSVVVPTYNEAGSVAELARRLKAALGPRLREILFVDDASPDGTADAVHALGMAEARVLTPRRRLGLGAALRYGCARARGEIIVTTDADLSFAPEDVARLLRELDAGADLVLGSRHMVEGRYAAGDFTVRLKRALSAAGNAVICPLMGLKIHDCSANFRAVRRAVWRRLRLRDAGNSVLLESILAVRRAGGVVVEVPVTFGPRRSGVSKISLARQLPLYFCRLLRHFWRYRLGERA